MFHVNRGTTCLFNSGKGRVPICQNRNDYPQNITMAHACFRKKIEMAKSRKFTFQTQTDRQEKLPFIIVLSLTGFYVGKVSFIPTCGSRMNVTT